MHKQSATVDAASAWRRAFAIARVDRDRPRATTRRATKANARDALVMSKDVITHAFDFARAFDDGWVISMIDD